MIVLIFMYSQFHIEHHKITSVTLRYSLYKCFKLFRNFDKFDIFIKIESKHDEYVRNKTNESISDSFGSSGEAGSCWIFV